MEDEIEALRPWAFPGDAGNGSQGQIWPSRACLTDSETQADTESQYPCTGILNSECWEEAIPTWVVQCKFAWLVATVDHHGVLKVLQRLGQHLWSQSGGGLPLLPQKPLYLNTASPQ